MPRLSWNEITVRAARFAAEWDGEVRERGESQSFWTQFLEVFGIDRRRAGGYFEYAVRLSGRGHGFIDMFLPGKLLVEHKSAGRDLARAQGQALGYLDGIPDHDLPVAIVACDFQNFQFLDLDTREVRSFPLSELQHHVRLFGFLIEEQMRMIEEASPVNRDAAERMARLHQALYHSGYVGHRLELFLVRLVFCHFADDAQIFDQGTFEAYLRNRTSPDGSDVGPRIAKLFEVLNTPPEQRSMTLDEDLSAFPYINGGLFAETIPMPDFNGTMRHQLLLTTRPDWSKVSPAIFGSMFQGVMDAEARHDIGAHYTSEEKILHVIKPLFLDSLYAEFEAIPYNRNRLSNLHKFHDKLGRLGFLDPACGCGNFLIIAYRELRRLEHRVLGEIQGDRVTLTDVADLLKVRVEQFGGIEVLEFPALVAQTALWLTDHQMNLEASERFGMPYARIPLTDGANIVCADALKVDWDKVRPAAETDYILGNPPFLGSRTMDKEQKAELRKVASGLREAGFLDFVVAWYLLADRYTALNPDIRVAFVSTNSISQGEQPGIFWPGLLANGQHINFAHRTFIWTNDARGVAHVHCVVVGFSRQADKVKQLYSYENGRGEPILELVPSISPYLIAGDEYVVRTRQAQISGAPQMSFGNMAADGGHLLMTRDERDALLAREPTAGDWILPFLGAREFIQGQERYCLWLEGITAGQLRSMPAIYERVAAVREVRAKSARPQLADIPHLFAQVTVRPIKPFLLVPRASSERRSYVPMGFFDGGVIVSDACLAVEGASLYDFGILTSRMHMDWLRTVGGRLKSDVRYSKDIVYNNFVFPSVSDDQRARVELLAQAVLDARASHVTDTLADLYDPTVTPANLAAAHRAIDTYVDRLYRAEPFEDGAARVAHLLELHRSMGR
ncbi:class I SAM-dependent DNA methyltransferase [Microbacterium sp. KSW4-11]|uniref:site-specific DNA-methyltransferase (adenine-specific) n=1 Tax=Microbacterium gawkjiense TaxID=3067309 RepID=A0ABU3GD10_9MICO|nr:DNA methyltransferase [Microbacterium sp. KSW4-11]MDT3317695.1 class I SAM-dependent DNA methyltransferase [Microbacterium sp. KSW4-11]